VVYRFQTGGVEVAGIRDGGETFGFHFWWVGIGAGGKRKGDCDQLPGSFHERSIVWMLRNVAEMDVTKVGPVWQADCQTG